MKYLLLMYHPESYWEDQTESRDQAEESAFSDFCDWLRQNEITWDAMALEPINAENVRSFKSNDPTSRMLPEVSDVITGLFLLDVPDESQIGELLDRCPHIGGTRLEVRKVTI